MNPAESATPAPIIVVWARPGAAPDADWLARLAADAAGPVACLAPPGGELPEGVEALEGDVRDPGELAGRIRSRWPDRPALLLRAGLRIAPGRLADLFHSESAAPALAFPGNHDPALNPLAGMELPEAAADTDLDALAYVCGERREFPLGPAGPDCLRLSPKALESLAGGAPWPEAGLRDDAYVHDPEAPLDCAPDGGPRPPLGHVRLRLAELLAEDIHTLPGIGIDGRPVTLHIAHNWGGGVARWIQDFIDGDAEGHHLVLTSASDFRGRCFGQWLELHAAGPGRGRIRERALNPAIADTAEAHAGYREHLHAILRRFGVGRVVVSSLIGHSLDCLATGLPTVQVLHDYYPAWPLLDFDPLTFAPDDGPPDLDRALATHGDQLLFGAGDENHWQSLTGQWRQRITEHGIRLAAPTDSVIQRWHRLLPADPPKIEHLPHGLRPFPQPAPVVRPAPAGKRPLHLVVVGRLNPGKGLGLLLKALPELTRHARITAVGTGRHGHELFGHGGVDVILDYDRDRLPELLAALRPDAALFTSTVAETWNYTLSEVRSLGLVPLATDLGSFAERIRDGVDGVLFSPHADALAAAVENLAANPETLETLRGNLPDEPDLATMADAYRALATPQAAEPARPLPAEPGDAEQARMAGQLADVRDDRDRLQHRIADQEWELARRADWARTMERQFRARSARVETLDRRIRELESERAELKAIEAHYHTLLASRSWRITRPLRAAVRMARNARARGVINPLRWPRLLITLIHHLRLRGLRQTLYLMQAPEIEHPAPPSVHTVATPQPGDPLVPVTLPAPVSPRVSVIVPVHNQVHFTSACLNSLARHPARLPCEVIVVDDASGDDTAAYLDQCRGIRVLTNETNLGFIGTCNRGAQAARGEFLVFLNNDTTVTDDWLDALIRPFSDHPDTGITGARLVYPDGRLQEAGGIVFNDASGWNYGRGDDPDRPEYRFLCQADYVSGACLAIRRTDFEKLGGFDDYYAPAYYEDTDLCFRMRETSKRVIYQPAATVIHHEGATSGTDESAGTKRYQAVNRDKFRERWAGTLAAHPEPVPGPEATGAVHAARHRNTRGAVLVIDAVTPTPDHDSGSVRLFALLEILVSEGYRVSFMPENHSWAGRYSEALQAAGVEVLCAPWVDDPEAWLTEHGASLDWVLVSRHYVLSPLMKMLRTLCPNARVVFDTVDLHFLREEREAELTGTTAARAVARRTREKELKLIRTADATLVVSPAEKELLAERVPDAQVYVVSNIHTVHGAGKPFDARRDLLFVGGFQHPPNRDAAEWLIDAILPAVHREIPEITLHLIGSRMPEPLRESRHPGLKVHGFVADLDPYLDGCRISLAPLRYGAGVKGKVNQAMSHGLPVVATPCAAEGMYAEHEKELLIAETAEDFAAQIVRLYNDPALWKRLQQNGMTNVERHFSVAAAREALAAMMSRRADIDTRK